MSKDQQRYHDNLRDEMDGAALYAGLAAAEPDPVRRDLFTQLSAAERQHADVWRKRIVAAGGTPETYRPGFRTRAMVWLARRFGPAFVLPAVASGEVADRNKYAGQPDASALAGEERGHAAVLQAAVSRRGLAGPEIARSERWHRRGGGNELRAAVLGANDGLVSNLCLVMGVAGAGAPAATILLTGVSGLLAGAMSMALGEWLSVTNSREFAQAQLAQEAQELDETPEAERNELALIFQAKGLTREEARRVADELMRDRAAALETLGREELGIDPEEMGGNPWTAAGFSFVLFSVGALFPVLPFFFAGGATGVAWSIGLSAVALGAIGLGTSLFSGRGPVYSMLRQVLIGTAAAAITYGAGALVGVSVG